MRVATLVGMVLALAGCAAATPSREAATAPDAETAQGLVALRSMPPDLAEAGRPTFLRECIGELTPLDPTGVEVMARYLGIPEERVPSVFCEAMFAGIRSGAIAEEDVGSTPSADDPRMWKTLEKLRDIARAEGFN